MPWRAGWRGPPDDVRRQVEAELGDDIYTRLSVAFERVVALDPGLTFTQWYRSPTEIIEEKLKQPKRAALYTQHGLGLAADVTPSSPAAHAQLLAALRAAGFQVRPYPDRLQLHVAALSDTEWSRSPLKKYLAARVRPLLPLLSARAR
jgi:hypothetical protein